MSDSGLSTRGEEQARRLGEWASTKDVMAVYSSESLRAKLTAEAISAWTGVSVTADASLNERTLSEYDGMFYEELQALRKRRGHSFLDPTQDWSGVSGVESDSSVYSRLRPFIESIYPNPSSRLVVAVTHAGVIKSFLYEELRIDEHRPNCIKVRNGAIVTLEYDAESAFQLIELLNTDIS